LRPRSPRPRARVCRSRCRPLAASGHGDVQNLPPRAGALARGTRYSPQMPAWRAAPKGPPAGSGAMPMGEPSPLCGGDAEVSECAWSFNIVLHHDTSGGYGHRETFKTCEVHALTGWFVAASSRRRIRGRGRLWAMRETRRRCCFGLTDSADRGFGPGWFADGCACETTRPPRRVPDALDRERLLDQACAIVPT